MKSQISASFERGAKTYDANALMQTFIAEKLSSRLPAATHIVEIGCGTGALTEHLRGYESLLCLDLSQTMLDITSSKVKNAKTILADAESYQYQKDCLVVANISLHWFDDMFSFLRGLDVEAVAFSIPTSYSFQSIKTSIQKNNLRNYFLPLPEPERIEQEISSLAFSKKDISYLTYRQDFTNSREMLKNFQKSGVGVAKTRYTYTEMKTLLATMEPSLDYDISIIILEK